MKITSLLVLFAIILSAFVFLNSGLLYYLNGQMMSDGRIINYAGIVRGMTQRAVKLELAGDFSQADKLITELDQIINGLKDGDRTLNLPQTEEGAFLVSMQEVSRAWTALKQTIYQTRQSNGFKNRLVQESESYFSLTNRAVGVAEKFSQNKVAKFRAILIVLSIINLGIILAIWAVIKRKIFAPFVNLAEVLPKMAAGDLSQRLKIKSEDEIGIMAASFNSMATKLQEFYSGLEKAKSRDEAILAGIGDGIFVIDRELNLVLFNHVAEEISGFKKREVLGKKYSEVLKFVLEDSETINDAFIKKSMTTGKTQEMSNHTLLVRKDSSRVAVADSASPLFDEYGAIDGCVVIFRDVEKERKIDRAKSEFVSIASHQLHTPTTSINWYSEMLLGEEVGTLNQKQKEYLKEIHHGNKRMIELVSALLTVSRIEMGKFAIEQKPTSVEKVADDTIEELQTQIAKKALRVEKKYESGISRIESDPTLLRIVFQNLFSNAIGYTPEKGVIHIGIKKTDSGVEVEVRDNGCGVPQSAQPKLFTKFFRADNARVIKTDGTGLGLYITKSIVEALGGTISFQSKEDEGTTFLVTMPSRGTVRRESGKKLT